MNKRSDDIKKLLQKFENEIVDNEFSLEIQRMIYEEKSEFHDIRL